MFFNRFLASLLFITCLIGSTSSLVAQRKNYPQGYFQFPIMPGQNNSLSGGFGDLRTNHFHAGDDIRTGGTTGYNVYAAAEGYISRIGTEKGSYGNVLYITHPNGFTTVYGHLESFSPKITQYLRQRQYNQHIWSMDISLSVNEITVQKGEIIGLSGNTGASGGPHLHFEIRDKNENAINPLLFGFSEIRDTQAPRFEKLILRTLTTESRVNGEFGRFTFSPNLQGNGNYVLGSEIKAKGVLGIELLAYDKAESSSFSMGISLLEVQVDGIKTYGLDLEKMPFDISKDINVHIDFAVAETNGLKIQKCYVADGNRLSIYETDQNKGKIHILDTLQHQVLITAKDTYGNTSTLSFVVLGDQQTANDVNLSIPKARGATTISTAISENMLVIRSKNVKSENPMAILQFKGVSQQIPMAYIENGEVVFLHDLRKSLVDFVQVDDASNYLDIKQILKPEGTPIYQEPNLKIDFSETLYDTLYVVTKQNGTRLSINTEKIPLKNYMDVTWNPANVPHSEKTSAYYVNDGRKFLGGKWTGDGIKFKSKELGDFQLITDSEVPNIRPIEINENDLRFVISDNLSGIKDFQCEVNGQWVLMDYEYKSARIWSEKLNELTTFTGDLLLKVTDNSGNVATFTTNIEEWKQRIEEERERALERARARHHKRHGKNKHGKSNHAKIKKRGHSSSHSSKKSKRKHR